MDKQYQVIAGGTVGTGNSRDLKSLHAGEHTGAQAQRNMGRKE